MSVIKSLRQIHNILQQTIIRIPYFLSPHKSTKTISLQVPPQTPITIKQKVEGNMGNKQNIDIEQHIQNTLLTEQAIMIWNIVGYQWKLYYDKDTTPHVSLILLFNSIQAAELFYAKFASNFDQSYISCSQDVDKQVRDYAHKYQLYFCRDISEQSSTKMENILYTQGRVAIQNPQSSFLRKVIKQVSKLIVVQGIRGEEEINRNKNAILPKYLLAFMNPKYLCSQATYYRWRVYSYLQGNGETDYQTAPFQITSTSPIYTPPPIYDMTEKYYNSILKHNQRIHITKLLDSINSNKYCVEEAMAFFLNFTHAAIQLSSILAVQIVEACIRIHMEKMQKGDKVKQNELKHLFGLFYLISDILFNSTSTIYRDIFTILLPPLLNRVPVLPQIQHKLEQLLGVWDRKFIFEQQLLRGLKQHVSHELPCYNPKKMQQMTRSQHESYKQLLKLESVDEIQQLCWKYGIIYEQNKIEQCVRNLAAVLAVDKRSMNQEMEPEVGMHDGEPISQKDMILIKRKQCRVVSLEDIAVKFLFEKDKEKSRSVTAD